MKKTFEVESDFILSAYNAACAEWKQKLKEKFPDAWPQSITDKIKTFADVEACIGKVILPYANPSNKQQISTNAFVKIQHLSQVLNEGWEPDFKNTNEYKWYPWFERKGSGWVFGGGCCGCHGGGLGSGFWYKTEELAIYAGKQFIDLYKEYLP